MEALMKGDVVVIPFPYSDLSNSKRRPALVAAAIEGDDVILCQITGEMRADRYSIFVSDEDFSNGGLYLASMIRPNKLFTADKSVIIRKIGAIKRDKIKEVEDKIINIFSGQ